MEPVAGGRQRRGVVAILTFFKIRGPSEAWEPGPVVLPAEYDTSAYKGVCRAP